MAERAPKPPESVEELLERYVAGERNFAGAQLSRAGFLFEDLGAGLPGADLSNADLSEAYLPSVNLIGVRLVNANLAAAYLSGADLSNADLTGADLVQADLRQVTLRRAKLIGARLHGVDLYGADLTEADLTNATLSDADLNGTDITGANFGGAKLGGTKFIGINLSPLCDHRTSLEHEWHSYVDHTSLVLSLRAPGLKDFLQHVGMPEVFVESMVETAMALGTDVFTIMRSTFISYGHPDEPFARKLYEALHRNGVRCFLFAEHATPGEKLHRTMKKGIADHDRVILICSRASLDRPGVLIEIEEALTREAKMKGESLLIPIRLDRYVFEEWKPKQEDLAEGVRSRVVADFENAATDQEKFQRGLRQLIAALRK